MGQSTSIESMLANTKPAGDCREWQGALCKGRGRVWFRGRAHYAYRVVFALASGLSIDGLVVRHTCDNPRCINPAHLIQGTQADNVKDMWERGRAKVLTGDANPKTKLSAEQVQAIRERFIPYDRAHGTRAMAREFGVSHPSITSVVRGESHPHAGGPAAQPHDKHANKVTAEQVREIRRRYVPRDRNNTFRALAAEFGLSACAVEDIVKRVTWKDVA